MKWDRLMTETIFVFGIIQNNSQLQLDKIMFLSLHKATLFLRVLTLPSCPDSSVGKAIAFHC